MKISGASLGLYIVWAAVLLVWVVGALFAKRTVQQQSDTSRGLHVALLLAGYSLLAFPGYERGWLAVHFVPNKLSFQFFGLAIATVGALIAIWARLTLGTNWSGRVTLKQDHKLIATGPYAFVRHPIYSGLLFAFAGTALVEGTLRCLAGLALVFVCYRLKIRKEEQLMMQTFPNDYPAYRRRVKALIPGVL